MNKESSEVSDRNRGGASSPLRYIHKIICFLRREHHYHEEIIINDNYIENHCKCRDWLGFEWHLVRGYMRSMSAISNLKRKRKWDESYKVGLVKRF